MTPVDLRAHAVVAPWQPTLPEAAAPLPARSGPAFREEVRKTLQQGPTRRGTDLPGAPRARAEGLRAPTDRSDSSSTATRGTPATRGTERRPTRSGHAGDQRVEQTGWQAAPEKETRKPVRGIEAEARSLRNQRQAGAHGQTTDDTGRGPETPVSDAEAALEVTGREPLSPELLALLAATIEVRTGGTIEAVPTDAPLARAAGVAGTADGIGNALAEAGPAAVAAEEPDQGARATNRAVAHGTANPLVANAAPTSQTVTPGGTAQASGLPPAVASVAAAATGQVAGVSTQGRGDEERLAPDNRREGAPEAPRVTSVPEVGMADLKVRPVADGQASMNQEGRAGDDAPSDEAQAVPTLERREGGLEGAVGPGGQGTREGLSRGTVRETAPVARTLAAEVQEAVRTGPRSIRMTLKPEALGEVQLRVALVGGGVRATLHVDSEDARDLLGRQLDQVRQSLVDQGIRVDRLEVVWRGAGTAEEQGRQAFGQGSQERERQEREQPARRDTEAWQQALNEAGQPADMSDIA
ncbi:MAG: flagellar hook-length control protein FliK [Candidatus Sericytochromatia bacterium]|nr:flagellar hook-length control protein FliK [Candidatus Sericytochromatia bacterium]